jgi:pyrimidine-nucleoside phosphorylase
MSFTDIIIKKRDGDLLTDTEIDEFISGVTNGSIPDYQAAAMLMAICINGLDDAETAELTRAMLYSGNTLDLSGIHGIKVDKHSTGGVADTTTLVLAPLCASLGLPVVKMSGRGLGHTGGTLDKMESIPKMKTDISIEQAVKQVNENGIVIMGQTSDLAPADKYLYALRDVTGTVESIPLIASSVMSKKLAAGADAIVLDVKCGNGAFMKNKEDALCLAKTMLAAGKKLGRKMTAFVTDMNQPLGMNIGNSLEVIEAIEILKGNVEGDLKTVALELGSEMLVLGEVAKNRDEALEMLNKSIADGRGIKKFKELITLQGGNPDVTDDYSLFPQPDFSLEIKAEKSGYVSSINTLDIGKASVELGAGRVLKTDSIDYAAGIVMKKRIGDKTEAGEVIAEVFAKNMQRCLCAEKIIKSAVEIGDEQPHKPKLITKKINMN